MTQKRIFQFWLPLFASWLLMTSEGPVISATINRLPNEVLMLAAQGVVISLSVFIESPIINLLATATALVKDRQSFLTVYKFTVHWMVILTIVTILVAFTPLFDLVVRSWLNTPDEVAEWVRPGLQIMTFWSAAIAWRRFLQGVLIGFDRTRQVAWGTVVRLAVSGGVALLLAVWGNVPGVILGAVSLMFGVVAEAFYATWAVRPLLAGVLSKEQEMPADNTPLAYRDLFNFHLPLAGTSVLLLLAQPLVISSLGRLPDPETSLAAWPMVFQMMLMMRAAAFALPEVVIALSKQSDSYQPLRRFSFWLMLISIVLMLLVLFTPLANWYLYQVQDATSDVGEIAVRGLMAFLLLPAFTVAVSWLRGVLIHWHRTRVINVGMMVNLLGMGIVLIAGIFWQLPGIPTAAIALTIAVVLELAYLWRQMA